MTRDTLFTQVNLTNRHTHTYMHIHMFMLFSFMFYFLLNDAEPRERLCARYTGLSPTVIYY